MISVCVTTYNGALYIREQLESILRQLSPDDEIIVSDDGSIDQTEEIIQSMQSPLIHFYKNHGEHGYTPNFENALKHAKGDYIFLADQDDIWQQNKVQYCLSLLSEYAMVVSDAILIDKQGKIIGDSFFSLRQPYKSFWGNIFKFGYLGCCMACRKEVVQKALPFPKNHKKCTHDNWLFLIAKFFYNVHITNQKLIQYRRHEKNTSKGGLNNTTTTAFKISYRLYLIWNIMKRIFYRNTKTI